MTSAAEYDAWRAELVETIGRIPLHVSDANIARLDREEEVTLSGLDREFFADAIMQWAVGKSFEQRRGITYGQGEGPTD